MLESNCIFVITVFLFKIPQLLALVLKLYFYGDSDALITKGLVALIITLYSGLSAEEILNANIDFFKQIGLREQLSMTRSNGLNMMLEKIRKYGQKYVKNG